jgi:hypothetical protein
MGREEQMPETIYWSDATARHTLMDRGRTIFLRIRDELYGKSGVIAIEPESGDTYIGRTLGQANALAYNDHPDVWMYWVRLDDPAAEILLPTW